MNAAAIAQLPAVPPIWQGERATVVILGDGPSLTPADVTSCQGKARVLAINYTIQLAPWADVWYGYHTPRMVEGTYGPPPVGLRTYSLEPGSAPWTVLRRGEALGLTHDRTQLRGNNSGMQAINLAVHLGAVRIILLGFDCQPAKDGIVNWRGDRVSTEPGVYEFERWKEGFTSIMKPLIHARVSVLNASRSTALRTFPRVKLASVLK